MSHIVNSFTGWALDSSKSLKTLQRRKYTVPTILSNSITLHSYLFLALRNSCMRLWLERAPELVDTGFCVS